MERMTKLIRLIRRVGHRRRHPRPVIVPSDLPHHPAPRGLRHIEPRPRPSHDQKATSDRRGRPIKRIGQAGRIFLRLSASQGASLRESDAVQRTLMPLTARSRGIKRVSGCGASPLTARALPCGPSGRARGLRSLARNSSRTVPLAPCGYATLPATIAGDEPRFRWQEHPSCLGQRLRIVGATTASPRALPGHLVRPLWGCRHVSLAPRLEVASFVDPPGRGCSSLASLDPQARRGRSLPDA